MSREVDSSSVCSPRSLIQIVYLDKVVSLGFSEAFDTVPHRFLPEKLAAHSMDWVYCSLGEKLSGWSGSES